MRIDHLHIENFKKFSKLDLDLNERFTLLIGENGAGKTSVLDALAVACSIWLAEPPDSSLISSRRNILSTEIRLESERKGDRTQFHERRPVVVSTSGQISDQLLTWTRKITSDGRRTSNAGAKDALAFIKRIYTQDAAGQNVLCPVLAYYGAGRAWLPSNERAKPAKGLGPARRWGAFYDCFNERIRFSELQAWFSRETTERGNREGRWRPGFEVVRRAILKCVPDAEDVVFDADQDDIILILGGVAQPFSNLSAGQRMLVALVADLAIKVVTQNTYLIPPDELGPEDNPIPRILKETPGVVLIDELDVHLHPVWQRRVAKDLKDTFPSIQFVCASHSPQVIGELRPEEIRLMRNNAIETPRLSFGQDSNWVIEVLMGGSSCDPSVKDHLSKIFNLIDRRRVDDAEAEVRILRAEVGNSDDIQRAESMIERIKLLGE